MNPATPAGAAYLAPASPAQSAWRDHLRSCAVCYGAPSDDEAALCNRGAWLWQRVCAEPPPTPVEFGANPAAIVAADITEPYRVPNRRGRR